MADRVIMLLHDYSLTKSGLINQFLIDTELSKELRVVLAEYDKEVELHSPGTMETVKRVRTKQCLGLEALTEKADFYWTLKGSAELHRRLALYEAENGRKY